MQHILIIYLETSVFAKKRPLTNVKFLKYLRSCYEILITTQMLGKLVPRQNYVVSNKKAVKEIKEKSNLLSDYLNFDGTETVQLIHILNNFPDGFSLADKSGAATGTGEVDFSKLPKALLRQKLF